MKKKEEITLGELSLAALFYLADIICLNYFSSLNPGWGMISSWPLKVWVLGLLSVALFAGFLATLYKFYFRKAYGKWAPLLLIAFIVLHLAFAAFLAFHAS